jgi:hypothetical protein
MHKIPTIFQRDFAGNHRVFDAPNPSAAWVFGDEGVATRKYDGVACASIRDRFFKRLALKGTIDVATGLWQGDPAPEGFISLTVGDPDERGVAKHFGWARVGDTPEDVWFRAALDYSSAGTGTMADGTYELVGPKVNGNPEGVNGHLLLRHELAQRLDAPTTFEGLREFFAEHDVEGIVWHHPDGRMAKIKGRDFGIRRRGTPDPIPELQPVAARGFTWPPEPA